MNPRGTVVMQVLGLPFYFNALLLGLAASTWFPGASLALLFAAFFLYSFLYSKALYYFTLRTFPPRPIWQFILAVLAVQAILLTVTLYIVAA